jgi:hypothetical protein
VCYQNQVNILGKTKYSIEPQHHAGGRWFQVGGDQRMEPVFAVLYRYHSARPDLVVIWKIPGAISAAPRAQIRVISLFAAEQAACAFFKPIAISDSNPISKGIISIFSILYN